MRIFNNTNQLSRFAIMRRLQASDASAECTPYKHVNNDPDAGPIGRTSYYVGVDSTLTDAQIEACLGPITDADTNAEAAESAQQAFLIVAKTRYAEMQAELETAKTRFLKLETWARTKGYTG